MRMGGIVAARIGRGPLRIGLLDRLAERLTPRRAFRYFAIAYLAGVAMLALPGAMMPALVVLPVAAYGAIVVYAQMALYTRLNTTVKDSPYFLGFILTLTGLIRIFVSIGAAGPDGLHGHAVVSEAGGAILSTLFGLLGRQMAHSVDPGDESREALFDAIADEMRDQADKLRTAQARFSSLLLEFTTAREAQFSREEQAAERWIGTLEHVGEALEKLTTVYRPSVQALLTEATELGNAFAASKEQVARDLGLLQSTLRASSEAAAGEIQKAFTEHAHSLATARVALAERVDEMVRAASAGASTLAVERQRIVEVTTEYAGAYGRLNERITATEGAADAARNALAGLAEEAGRAGGQMASDLRTAGADTREALAARMKEIGDDVRVIDHLLTEVAALLADRYQLPPEPRAAG